MHTHHLYEYISLFWIYFIAIFCSVHRLPPSFNIPIDYYKVETTKDLVINTPRPEFSWKIPIPKECNVQQVDPQDKEK